MKRTVIIIIIIAAAIVGYFAYEYLNRTEISATTSSRAANYLEAQKIGDNAKWKNVNINPDDSPTQQDYDIEDCFKVRVPFKVTNVETKDPCYIKLSSQAPRGSVRIYTQETTYTSLGEVSDIKMRQQFPEKYKEKKLILGKKEYWIFENVQDGVEIVSFHLSNGRLLIVSMQMYGSEDLHEVLSEILQSITVYN